MQPKTIKFSQTTALGQLLQAYKARFKAPEKTVIDAFCESVYKVLAVPLASQYVSYVPATRTIHIRAPGVLKQEIKMREHEIRAHLEKNIGVKNAPKYIL